MSRILRSKAGFAAAGLYLLVTLPSIAATAVFFILRYYNDNQPVPFEDPGGIVSFALTLPWSVGVTILGIIIHGGHGVHTGRFVIVIGLVVSAIVNAAIFYLLAYWLTKAFKYLYYLENPKP